LELIHIHRIVAFDQRPFMRPFIEYCNDQRKKATTDFESGLYELFANSFYGKTVENVRRRMTAKLVTDPQKMVRAAGKTTFKRCEIINSDLVLVETERTKITLNKPVAIGFTILEFAKLVMYGFYYDCLLPKFGNKLYLCFTDTDSFICHIETPDLFADMADISGCFDTSNFHEHHFLFSATNKRVLGKFKSETGDCLPQEFCGLRSKMYSLLTPSTDTSLSFVKAKGVPKSYVKKNVRHEQYLHILNTRSSTKCKFRSFRSKRHVLSTREITKTCLSCIDDKRFLLEDAVHSLAYGHYRIPR